eukprot:CAMPEP_0198282538 /NCGR_PEP_ID=MMETSP1449-20131203/2325_1 /TAXON_ID=420275 /ORGANISM="Attheya septentrionalis, Strain CCMP2084" /LENGTH=327 /DNA_ID=CAMNT_0043978813 /DNA_START=503 /DNA_END=1482 /DNA_ORIENTATION=-
MPTRVTFRVKRGSSLPVHEQAKKQRTTNVPCIRVKSEIVTTVEEVVTVKTEEIDDGSTAYDHSASESALCEPSSDPHLSHSASTSSTTSKQFTSQVGTSNNAEMCAFEGRVESDVDSLPNQDSENLPMNNVFSELQREEELEYEEGAQNSTTHGPAAMRFGLNKKEKTQYPSWDDSFQELADFKAINGHTNVVVSSGPLGGWVNTQRQAFHQLEKVKHSPLTNERRYKLNSIGFEFICRPTGPPWDQRFQELVDFKKIYGHTNVPTSSGQLGSWVNNQQHQYHRYKEGKQSPLTNDKREKLESIGFVFLCLGPPWDDSFQELVDFKA